MTRRSVQASKKAKIQVWDEEERTVKSSKSGTAKEESRRHKGLTNSPGREKNRKTGGPAIRQTKNNVLLLGNEEMTSSDPRSLKR